MGFLQHWARLILKPEHDALRRTLYSLEADVRDLEEIRDNLKHELKIAESKLESKPEIERQFGLQSEVYAKFKGKLPRNVVTNTTTDIQAGVLIGQQQVLDLIEQEWLL